MATVVENHRTYPTQEWLVSVVPRDKNEPPCHPVNKPMRAGHPSLKASRFNIASTAECECGDGLQTEEHIFWDRKLYEDQKATVMDILSTNSKKDYSKSVTELLRLEGKRFVQGVCYFINRIPICIKKKKK
jgi:hypothetical protein